MKILEGPSLILGSPRDSCHGDALVWKQKYSFHSLRFRRRWSVPGCDMVFSLEVLVSWERGRDGGRQ